MTTLSSSVLEGHYAKKQLSGKSRMISWSHGARFNMGLKLARQFQGKNLLDYGCGDGTFLAMLMGSASSPAMAVGSEVTGSLVEDCRSRLGHLSGLSFNLVEDLDKGEWDGYFDCIICMEVLEHIADLDPIFARFDRLLAPEGKLLISVPVETGLPLVVKTIFRRLAGWRGLKDYPGQPPYSIREFWTSVFARSQQHIVRPAHRNGQGQLLHSHKGFNWMYFQSRLTDWFELEQTHASPISWLSPHLASQAWFLSRKR